MQKTAVASDTSSALFQNTGCLKPTSCIRWQSYIEWYAACP